jgi:hypothetical protein
MSEEFKKVEAVTLDDFKKSRVWEFAPDAEHGDETYVRAVKRLPVTHLVSRLVSCELCLRNGTRLWGVLGDVDVADARLTEHYLSVSLFRPDGTQFYLARYFDISHKNAGPDDLAEFLGIPKADIFPIEWDVSDVVLGRPDLLRGSILSEPRVRLSRSERIAMSIPRPPRPQGH